MTFDAHHDDPVVASVACPAGGLGDDAVGVDAAAAGSEVRRAVRAGRVHPVGVGRGRRISLNVVDRAVDVRPVLGGVADRGIPRAGGRDPPDGRRVRVRPQVRDRAPGRAGGEGGADAQVVVGVDRDAGGRRGGGGRVGLRVRRRVGVGVDLRAGPLGRLGRAGARPGVRLGMAGGEDQELVVAVALDLAQRGRDGAPVAVVVFRAGGAGGPALGVRGAGGVGVRRRAVGAGRGGGPLVVVVGLRLRVARGVVEVQDVAQGVARHRVPVGLAPGEVVVLGPGGAGVRPGVPARGGVAVVVVGPAVVAGRRGRVAAGAGGGSRWWRPGRGRCSSRSRCTSRRSPATTTRSSWSR